MVEIIMLIVALMVGISLSCLNLRFSKNETERKFDNIDLISLFICPIGGAIIIFAIFLKFLNYFIEIIQ